LRTAIVLLEPDDRRNHIAIGFDMATAEEQRGAMLEAIETGAVTATPPLTLSQGITEGRQDGIVIFLPLQQTIGPEVEGFAFAPVRVVDLFDAVLEEYDPALKLRVSDDASPDRPLFESASFAEDEAEEDLVKHTRLAVAGREWILTAVPSREFDTAIQLRLTLFSALVFPLLAISTGYAVHWQSTAIRRTRALNEAVQHSVEQKDLLLREMAHRMKNALTRVSAIARQTARESADKAALIENLNARLQAMSAAQDLLVLSGTDSADLEELLRFEIDQVSGSAANPGRLSGPPVRLNERQVHALALVFHELATNALKYGAGAKAGGEIRIYWAVEPSASGEHLRLIWEELTPSLPPAASDAAPGPGSGFGTRLLEAMVAGELGGRLTRDLQPGCLTIEIRFPLFQETAT
jgi:two-component sensor histidine kinase